MISFFSVVIYSLEKKEIQLETFEFNIKTINGSITILPNHTPIISFFYPTHVKIIDKYGKKYNYLIGYGTIMFKNNKLIINSDFFSKTIDLSLNPMQEYHKNTALLSFSDKKIISEKYNSILLEFDKMFKQLEIKH